MKILNFFIASLKMKIDEQLVYKFNFILRMMTLLSFDLVLPLITILIYLQSNGFPGWSFYQILMFQGVFMLINSFDRMFFQGVDWTLSWDVRNGQFDRYLLFPVETLSYISFTNLMLEHVSDFVIGIGLIIYSAIKLQLTFTILSFAMFLGYIILGILFVFSLAILKNALIVRAVRIGRLGEFFQTIEGYGQYPVEIYSQFLSSVFRYVIPLTVLAYYPSITLLRMGNSNFLLIAAIILTIFFLAQWFWKTALKYYTSAGG